MKLLILTIIIVGFCVFALSFNIIFRKNGKFPDGEISHNKALTKQGIQCAKVEERKLWNKKSKRNAEQCSDDDCAGCGGSCGIQNEQTKTE